MAYSSHPEANRCKICRCWKLIKEFKLGLCSNCYVKTEIEWLLVIVPQKVEMTLEDYVNAVVITRELEK